MAAAAEPLIGVVPNSTDGRAAIMQAAQAALNAMISAGKLAPGALIELDGDNLPQGDSVWFKISFQDVDAVEKVYLLYSIGLA